MNQVKSKEQSSSCFKNEQVDVNFNLSLRRNNHKDTKEENLCQVFQRPIKLHSTSTISDISRVFILTLIVILLIPSNVNCFMNLFLSRNETFRLLGK